MEYLQSFLPEPLVANQVEMNVLHHGFVELSVSFNQNSPRYPTAGRERWNIAG